MKNIIGIAILALSLGACGSAAVAAEPSATPAPTPTPQIITKTETVTVTHTPDECLAALGGLFTYTSAQDAILGADDAAYQALADSNVKALDRAIKARAAAIKARDAIDFDAIIKLANACSKQSDNAEPGPSA